MLYAIQKQCLDLTEKCTVNDTEHAQTVLMLSKLKNQCSR